jgi:hypothetical protein
MRGAGSTGWVGVPKAFFWRLGSVPSGVRQRHLLGHGPMQALPSRVMATPPGLAWWAGPSACYIVCRRKALYPGVLYWDGTASRKGLDLITTVHLSSDCAPEPAMPSTRQYQHKCPTRFVCNASAGRAELRLRHRHTGLCSGVIRQFQPHTK